MWLIVRHCEHFVIINSAITLGEYEQVSNFFHDPLIK